MEPKSKRFRRDVYFKIQFYDQQGLVWKDFHRNGFDEFEQAVTFLQERGGDGRYRIVKHSPDGATYTNVSTTPMADAE